MSIPSRSALPLAGTLLLLAACNNEDPGPVDDTGDGIHYTPHCGDITGEETWYASDNRHRLDCDVVVTGTLTIDPGAEVYFMPGTTLRVDGGTLNAVGDQHQPIFMGSAAQTPGAGDHGGIVGTSATINIDWLTLQHGGAEGGLLQLTGGTAEIGNSRFSNGMTTGVVGDGTLFRRLTNLNIAYVPTGLVLPWNAPQVLAGIVYDQVGTQSISLPDPSVTEITPLPDVGYMYVHEGDLTVEKAAKLDIQPGAMLQMGGDMVVYGGLSVFGSYESPAQLQSIDGTPFTVSIESSAFQATFYFAVVHDATFVSAADELYAKTSRFTDAQGDVFTITGHVKDDRASNLDNNTFSGTGYGLVIAPWVLGSVGTNNLSGSAFNGVAVMGGTITDDIDIAELPSPTMRVLGPITVDGATLAFTGGIFLFEDDTFLTIRNGELEVSGASFVHADSTPGGWYGVTFDEGSDFSFLDNTEVAYGGADGGANVTARSSLTIRSCSIHDSAGWGVYVEAGASPEFEDNTYSNNALGNVGP